jgi:hypothetical protein
MFAALAAVDWHTQLAVLLLLLLEHLLLLLPLPSLHLLLALLFLGQLALSKQCLCRRRRRCF